jgi:hypothetical protein
MANDPYNLTPNPFPSGKGNQKGFVGLLPSYPPHPLSLGKGGTEKRISSPDFKLANLLECEGESEGREAVQSRARVRDRAIVWRDD